MAISEGTTIYPMGGGNGRPLIMPDLESLLGDQPAPQPKSWLDFQHPDYARLRPRWGLAYDFYTAEVADQRKITNYLIKRSTGEPTQAYAERAILADYTPHLGTVLDTVAGMLFAVEDRISRIWTDEKKTQGLGDPNEQGTPARRLWLDGDGNGTGWATIWREFAIELLIFQKVWVLVDTVDGTHVVKFVSPLRVPNWVDGATGPTEVLMIEHRDRRKTLTEDPKPKCTYMRWALDGWTRWQKSEDGEERPEQLPGAEGSGTYAYVDREKRPTLPIFPIELPIRRYVAWILAKKAQSIFNIESVRDQGLRNAGFAKLLLGVANDTQFESLKQMLAQGFNALPVSKDAPGMHSFIAPPSEPTINAGNVLKEKVESLWTSCFQMYSDSAQQKTATEVKQDVAAGIGAFLQLLKAAVDDAENGALWRLEQAEYSKSPDRWGGARVERSDDFSTIDLGAVLDKQRERYFGMTDPLPIGRSALIQLATEACQQDGLPVNKDEITAALDAQLLNRVLQNMNLLGTMPPIIKARLMVKLAAATGLIDEKETVDAADGEKIPLFKQLLADAEAQAQKQQDLEDKMNAMPPAGGKPFGG